MAKADLTKRPDEVAAMFDGVAEHYDRTNTLLSVGNAWRWRIATVHAVHPAAGERVLDLAAGTGTSSMALAKSGAEVVAADFSKGMIEVGRRKHPGLTFAEADAEALPFPDGEFDAVTISFGLRNVEDPKKALAEMYRVTKPSGRLVICEFSKPPRALFRAGYWAYLKYVMPTVVAASSSNPEAYTYLLDSIRDWPDQGTLSQWIRGAGFTRVAYRNLTAGIVALHRGRKPATAPRRRVTRPRTARAGAPAQSAGSEATEPHATTRDSRKS